MKLQWNIAQYQDYARDDTPTAVDDHHTVVDLLNTMPNMTVNFEHDTVT